MIKIFITRGCLGCRKAITFFNENNIEFIKKDILIQKINRQEILDILTLTENGFDDLISFRSKEFKKIFVSASTEDLYDLSTNQIIDLIIENPSILLKPIIIQYRNEMPFRLLIGLNQDDIKIFLRNDTTKIVKKVDGCSFRDICELKSCTLKK